MANPLRSILIAADRIFGRFVSQSYNLAKLRSFLRFLWSRRKEPLLVYQMGKVGSSTIFTSLKACAPLSSRYSIYHVHRLTADGLKYAERLSAEARKRLRNTSLPKQLFNTEHLWVGQWLGRRILDPRDEHKWLIITLVREPISRNVASLFQNLETRLFYDYRSKLQSEGQEAVVADVKKLFYENYLDGRTIDRIETDPLTWLDSELKRVFGVDVYAGEFPTSKGYEIYDTKRAKVLLLRLEDLDQSHAKALKEFLQIDGFTLVRANTGKTKAYAELYKAFLRDLTFPPEYIDEVYESKYARYFYTEREIQGFRVKWKKLERSAGAQPGWPT